MADDGAPGPEEVEALQEQLAAFSVDQFVLSAASTIATLALAKLDNGDLPEAKKAIDALQSLLPHVQGDFRGELQQALAQLQVAYAGAASA